MYPIHTRITIETTESCITGRLAADLTDLDDEIPFVDDETGRTITAYGWLLTAEEDDGGLYLYQ